MPKSNAESARDSVARRRARARMLGLCSRCCKEQPDVGRAVCTQCHREKTNRARRRRSTKPLEASLGNGASPNGTASLSPAQQLLAASGSLTIAGHPRYATEILDAARRVAAQIGDRDSEAEALERLARQAWANADTPKCVEYAQQLLSLPLEKTSIWRIQGFLRLARALTALGRPAEALEILREAAKVCDYTRFESLATYVEVRAYAEQGLRMKSACLRDFQLATDMAQTKEDDWSKVFALINYAVAAIQFGEAELGCQTHDLAIEVANRLGGWPISYAKLSLAQGLLILGQPVRARDLVAAICEEDLEHTTVAMKYAWISEILSSMLPCRFAQRADIEELFSGAMRSEEPLRIAPMAVALHQQYLTGGRKAEASSTLTKVLRSIRNPHNAEWLTIVVVRHGSREQLMQLAALWSELLEDDVATAHHALLRSRLAALDRSHSEAAALAGRAEAIYRKGGLRYFEAAAMELGGRLHESRKAYITIGAVYDARRVRAKRIDRDVATDLTKRQREVVRLVLRGLSVPEVASALNISPRTAEHHLFMTMQSLGIVRRADLRVDPRLVHLSPNP